MLQHVPINSIARRFPNFLPWFVVSWNGQRIETRQKLGTGKWIKKPARENHWTVIERAPLQGSDPCAHGTRTSLLINCVIMKLTILLVTMASPYWKSHNPSPSSQPDVSFVSFDFPRAGSRRRDSGPRFPWVLRFKA